MEIPFGNPWDWARVFARDQNRSGLDFTAGNGLLSGKGNAPSNDDIPLQDRAIDLSEPILRYPDAQPVIDPNTERPYPAPRAMDVSANAAQADQRRDDGAVGKGIWMLSQFPAGRPQDYQRPYGYWSARRHDPGSFIGDYTDVTAYNLGVAAARAGYSLDDALKASGLYNRWFGNPQPSDTQLHLQQERVNNISHGWRDAKKW